MNSRKITTSEKITTALAGAVAFGREANLPAAESVRKIVTRDHALGDRIEALVALAEEALMRWRTVRTTVDASVIFAVTRVVSAATVAIDLSLSTSTDARDRFAAIDLSVVRIGSAKPAAKKVKTSGPMAQVDAWKARTAKTEAARNARNDQRDRDAAEAKGRGFAKAKKQPRAN